MAKYIKTEEGYKGLEESISAVTDNKMDKTNPTGTGSFSMNRKAGTVVGGASHAEGNNTTASGYASHAEGNNTTASGSDSHAEGISTTASGQDSHAEGYETSAGGKNSHAEGGSTKASGNDSHAEGSNTTASGIDSHAEGGSTNAFSSVVTTTNPTTGDIITAWKTKKFSIAKGDYSHVEGKDNLALDKYSHAEGGGTTASNYYSHAEGSTTTASGFGSHAEGGSTTASKDYSHAEGMNTTASNHYSHAEGTSTTASGYSSHAEGSSTKASGAYSHAEGDSTTASGYSSHAEGISTEASGDKSHAEGGYTTASGNYSHAEGRRTKASGKYSHAQGIFNIEDTSNIYADIIGNGTSDTARSNAATVDWNGNAWFAGDAYTGSTSGTNKDDGSKKLATEEYVNSSIAATSVLYTAQSLTDEQKVQARANIGAGTPYTLLQATAEAIGGVKADSAEAADTQPVRIGTDGKLYTAAAGTDISLGLTSAVVGQIIKVKAIDENGKPTEWETADMQSGEASFPKFEKLLTHTITEEEIAANPVAFVWGTAQIPNLNDFNVFTMTIRNPDNTTKITFTKWVKLKINNVLMGNICSTSQGASYRYSISANRLYGFWVSENIYNPQNSTGTVLTPPYSNTTFDTTLAASEAVTSIGFTSYNPDYGLTAGIIVEIWGAK